ncbi:MAG: hypothetical protein AAFX79_08240 [Planctomycetota bacterium]
MRAAHRKMHVALWLLVLPAVLAVIAAGLLLRTPPPEPGPAIDTGTEVEAAAAEGTP